MAILCMCQHIQKVRQGRKPRRPWDGAMSSALDRFKVYSRLAVKMWLHKKVIR